MKPLKTGMTLSATILLFYALCTLVWIALPEPFIDFVNALFHGLDFRRLQLVSRCPGGPSSIQVLCSPSGFSRPGRSLPGSITRSGVTAKPIRRPAFRQRTGGAREFCRSVTCPSSHPAHASAGTHATAHHALIVHHHRHRFLHESHVLAHHVVTHLHLGRGRLALTLPWTGHPRGHHVLAHGGHGVLHDLVALSIRAWRSSGVLALDSRSRIARRWATCASRSGFPVVCGAATGAAAGAGFLAGFLASSLGWCCSCSASVDGEAEKTAGARQGWRRRGGWEGGGYGPCETPHVEGREFILNFTPRVCGYVDGNQGNGRD